MSAQKARTARSLPTVDASAPVVAGCGCGCAAGDEAGTQRKAVGVDPAIKARNVTRLRRIEGQVRGLQRMVDEDRYCPDIMTQIASVQEALRAVTRALMRNHLEHCATRAIAAGPDDAQRMYDELADLMHRFNR